MRAGEKRRSALGAERREQVHELHFASRRFLGETLPLHFPSGALELLDQIRPGLFDRFAAGRPWAEIDHRLDMGERFVAGKIFPDFSLIAALCLGIPAITTGENGERKNERDPIQTDNSFTSRSWAIQG